MQSRRKLTDILNNADKLQQAWQDTQAADDMGPLPPGEYTSHLITGELIQSRSNQTPGYRLTFRILEGDYAARRCWLDLWLTPAALPMTKRDLAKIGVSALDQLENAVPPRIRCKVRVALRKNDHDEEYNAVRSFEVIGIDPPEVDPFAIEGEGEAQQ
jgi:hypothetical protein